MERLIHREGNRRKEKEILEGTGIEAIDITPKLEKFSTPTLVAPGWATTPESLEKFLEALSDKGRMVLSLSHNRKLEIAGALSLLRSKKEITGRAGAYSFGEIQKVFSILALIIERGIDKVDAIAYSEAGINVSIAASEYPEKFRSIVYVDPAGMIGKDTFPKLLGRFSLESIRSTLKSLLRKEARESMKVQWKESLKYIAENIPLALKETIAVSQSDIVEMVKSSKEQGIAISIISGEDDKLFSSNNIKENIGSELIDDFRIMEEDILKLYLNPRNLLTSLTAH